MSRIHTSPLHIMSTSFLAAVVMFPAPALATTYGVDFIATAARGYAMNDLGDVVGTSYVDEGCGSFCLPANETVAWVAGSRIVLPEHPDYSGITVTGINNDGWISGYAGIPGMNTAAVIWKPVGSSYELTDLGFLPDTASTDSIGIDDFGRVVGWASSGGAIPTTAVPYVWSETDGMVDLEAEGYPTDIPLAISRGGMVATTNSWYSLDDVATVATLAAAPRGYVVGKYATVINDTGDQARLLLTTSSSSLTYGFRYHTDGTWVSLSTGFLTGIGSINDAGDVSGPGYVAFGPDGTTEALSISSAYPGVAGGSPGIMNADGDILALATIGRSSRLVRLTPVDACTSGCIRVSGFTIRSRFVQDPSWPGYCFEGGSMYNTASVTLTVTNESGTPLRNVTVTGRWLDDYWTDQVVTGRTNNLGQLRLTYRGLCGTGAIAFLVDSATRGPLTLDRTTGTLTGYTIPS